MFGHARSSTPPRKAVAGIASLLVGLALVALVGIRSSAPAPGSATETTWQGGTPVTGAPSLTESVAGLMREQRIADRSGRTPVSPRPEQGADFRRSLPENPRSPAVAQLPGGALSAPASPSTPQTLGTSFTGATISDTPGLVPPPTSPTTTRLGSTRTPCTSGRTCSPGPARSGGRTGTSSARARCWAGGPSS